MGIGADTCGKFVGADSADCGSGGSGGGGGGGGCTPGVGAGAGKFGLCDTLCVG